MSMKSNWISLIALMVLVVALPYYALLEEGRMSQAQAALQEQSMQEATVIYINYCSTCHGIRGEGVGAMPPLNNPSLAGAEASMLTNTIARAVHGTAMAAWHISEGGALNDYQISQLVDLIQTADWENVSVVALAQGVEIVAEPAAENGLAYMLTEAEEDPHRCIACHEDPLVHRDRFGLNCARCHSTVTWTPAYLTRHIFMLDHGGQGTVACTTCHVENYYTNTCYGCHDHTPEQMQDAHVAENIIDYSACTTCHPTGQPDEARMMMQTGALSANEPPSGLAASEPVLIVNSH